MSQIWQDVAVPSQARRADPLREEAVSLQPHAVSCVPEDTACVARAIFPDGTLVMRMDNEMDMLFRDGDFADVFVSVGLPAESPVRLALVTLLQFWEGSTARQATDAVRARIDCQYLLCLERTDRGFHHTVLRAFRSRLLLHRAERRAFDAILGLVQERGLLKARSRQRRAAGVVRLLCWMAGAPKGQTRASTFARLSLGAT